MIKLATFYPPLSRLCDALTGTKARIYLVGGALRDFYLNRHGRDLDFAVDHGAVTLSRKLARHIRGTFVLLDQEHGSARVVKRIGSEIWTFDLTDWRGKTIQEDLSLRDFTINALAVDITEGAPNDQVLLEVKGSRRDLKNGIVRMISKGIFKDDPLRLLRAFSLSAGFGFKIDQATMGQIKKDAHLISMPAAERIHEEIFKVLASSRAYGTLQDMDKVGLLPKVIPQITVMYKVYQGGYHHLDVWEHSLEVVRCLEKHAEELSKDQRIKDYLQEIIGGGHSRLSLLKMAALLHDIGKPETRRKEKGRMTFHGHEHVGEHITRQVARHLKLSVKERYFLENAVRMHLRPGYLSNFKRPSEKAFFRYFRDTGPEAASIAILAMADQAATRGPLTTRAKHKHHTKICRMIIDRFFAIKEKKPKVRLLTGHDLIKTLKLKPSELFGKILGQVEEAAALGKISTRQEALALARQIIKK